MSDIRKDRSDEFKKAYPERGNPHGGRGRRARRDIAEQFETQTGHPLGETEAGGAGHEPARGGGRPSVRRGQHARKGQAESPRELNHNQPEKRREGHR